MKQKWIKNSFTDGSLNIEVVDMTKEEIKQELIDFSGVEDLDDEEKKQFEEDGYIDADCGGSIIDGIGELSTSGYSENNGNWAMDFFLLENLVEDEE